MEGMETLGSGSPSPDLSALFTQKPSGGLSGFLILFGLNVDMGRREEFIVAQFSIESG